MKIRLLNQSIRLRISKKDLAELDKNGKLSSFTEFGGNKLYYTLHSGEVPQPQASFAHNTIRVDVPRSAVENLVRSNLVGIFHKQVLKSGAIISIKLEKDYKCLTMRNEDESDLFINPNEGKITC